MTPGLRLLADDLTGALDSATEFVGLCGPVRVRWDADDLTESGCLALDSGSRELGRDAAVAAVARLAPALREAGIPFKKVDSLLRGAWAAELAATLRAGGFRQAVLAPAFPAQGRRTLAGIQEARRPDGTWVPVGPALVDALAVEGVPARRGLPGAPLPEGVATFDAVFDSDLDAAVAAGRAAAGPVLWCGTGGLARALARGHECPASRRLPKPILGLFGSDQAITATQLLACGALATRIAPDEDRSAEFTARLHRDGAVFASVELPAGLSRGEAARRIACTFADLVSRLERPRTLIVAGGETLRALCATLGGTSLIVHGQVAPGVPRFRMVGGVWDGVEIVSKSGAFGPPELWRELLAENGMPARPWTDKRTNA